MDSRLVIGASTGLLLALVFAWVAMPNTGTIDIPEPTTHDASVVAETPADRPRRQRQHDRISEAPADHPSMRTRPGRGGRNGHMQTANPDKRDWESETLAVLEDLQSARRLTRREMREIKGILYDLHKGLEENQKMAESGKKPDKAIVHRAEEMRLKTELRLVEVLGEEGTDALRDVYPELSGQEQP